jgi:hypothetical protein
MATTSITTANTPNVSGKQNSAAVGAECEPNAELRRAPARRVADQAIHAHRGQEQGERRKASDQREVDPPV